MRSLKANPILSGLGFFVLWVLLANFFRLVSMTSVGIGAIVAIFVTIFLYWLNQRPEEYVEDTWSMTENS